jgi:MraZ protein
VLGKESMFYAFLSFLHKAIECRNEAFMDALSKQIGDLAAFSDEQDALAEAIFAGSHAIPFDPEGRVVLPENLLEEAGVTDQVAFVGKGKSFQIWEPASHQAFQQQARERALGDRLALRQRPQAGPLGSGPVENGT